MTRARRHRRGGRHAGNGRFSPVGSLRMRAGIAVVALVTSMVVTNLAGGNGRASAAGALDPDLAMSDCVNARQIDGKPNPAADFSNRVYAWATRCSQVEGSFRAYLGPARTVSASVENCRGTRAVTYGVPWSGSVAQTAGTYSHLTAGDHFGLFDFVNAAWMNHPATFSLGRTTVTMKSWARVNIPLGQVMVLTWTPKMYQRTFLWKVEYDQPQHGRLFWTGSDRTTGPVRATGGQPDGVLTPLYHKC